jgi:hypothetical protein
MNNPKDIRSVIKAYDGKDFISEFDSLQRQMYEQDRGNKERQLQLSKKTSGFRKLLGLGSSNNVELDHVPSYEEFQDKKTEVRTKTMQFYKEQIMKEYENAKKAEEEYYKNNPVTISKVFDYISGKPQQEVQPKQDQ